MSNIEKTVKELKKRKVFDNNFIYYAKKDSSFTSLNLKTEKSNVSIRSILNENIYVGTVMNDIIIERD